MMERRESMDNRGRAVGKDGASYEGGTNNRNGDRKTINMAKIRGRVNG